MLPALVFLGRAEMGAYAARCVAMGNDTCGQESGGGRPAEVRPAAALEAEWS
jgi:hypothetical protein